jgi:hypothetical protein
MLRWPESARCEKRRLPLQTLAAPPLPRHLLPPRPRRCHLAPRPPPRGLRPCHPLLPINLAALKATTLLQESRNPISTAMISSQTSSSALQHFFFPDGTCSPRRSKLLARRSQNFSTLHQHPGCWQALPLDSTSPRQVRLRSSSISVSFYFLQFALF